MTAPIVQTHAGIWVVRDDLHPGGTKARFIGRVFDGVQEAVYASPPEGGAQTSLAHVARVLGKKATIFVAQRAKPHARTLEAARMGADICTCPAAVIEGMFKHPLTDIGLARFLKDWEQAQASAATK